MRSIIFHVRTCRAVASTTSLLLCVALLAQQPPPPNPNPAAPDAVFSVTTTLVQVDAVVTDSKGRYITDLTPEDFAIFQDGKQQKITNFSYIRAGQPPKKAAKSARTQAPKWSALMPPLPPAPLRPEDVRRTIVLMVDDLGLSFESVAAVRVAVHKFVERQMQPGDLVAICRTSAGSGALQQFTTDKRILLAIADGLRWNPNGRAGISFFEPYGKYSDLAEGLGGRSVSLDPRNSNADVLDFPYSVERNAALTVGTLGAIYYIVGALREMPGRKSIVLFSDGLQVYTAGQGPVMHTTPGDSQPMESNSEVLNAMRQLVDRANRASTVIYTMHAAGLQTMQPGAEDRITSTGKDWLERQEALSQGTTAGQGRDLEFNVGQQGLADLAYQTGGIPYQNGNDMNWGLDRVLEDQQGYYLIGFKPAGDTFQDNHGKPNYHHITVKMTQPKLHVRTRTGFFGETDDATLPKYTSRLEQMRAAMLSPFRSSDVRLRLTALYAEVPKQGPVVRNLLHIDTQDLTFQSPNLNLADQTSADGLARVEIIAVASSMGGQQTATLAHSYTVTDPAGAGPDAIKSGIVYSLDVPVKKAGPYQIQVAVRDTATGRVGSASQFLEIPELKKGHLALTSVVLQDGKRPAGAPAYAGMTPATRQFISGGELEYFCLVEGKKMTAEDIDAQIWIVRDGKDVFKGPAKLVPVPKGGLAVLGVLKLSEKMTPGDYYLGIIAAERKAPKKNVVAQWTDFEIIQ